MSRERKLSLAACGRGPISARRTDDKLSAIFSVDVAGSDRYKFASLLTALTCVESITWAEQSLPLLQGYYSGGSVHLKTPVAAHLLSLLGLENVYKYKYYTGVAQQRTVCNSLSTVGKYLQGRLVEVSVPFQCVSQCYVLKPWKAQLDHI